MKMQLTGKQIWSVPIALGFISASGLIAALFFDGIGNVISWIALAVPVAVAVWYAVRQA